MRTLLFLLSLGCAFALQASVETFEFADEQQRQRYLEFANELRCPKCQNQNLADSNAPIAQDLRNELHRLLVEGKTDREIVDFMVTRYGEYVLYEPPLEVRTVLLWSAPVLMVCGGLLVVAGIVRRSRQANARAAAASLSESERRRLEELLREDASRQ